jgi:hypothetical protein
MNSSPASKIFLAAVTIASLLAGGCAAGRSIPVIDPAGVDMGLYQADLAECEQISRQVEQKAGAGAAGGAVIGGLIGAITGDSDRVAKSAGTGAVIGGAKGAGATQRERDQVVKNCLRNRGYKILN